MSKTSTKKTATKTETVAPAARPVTRWPGLDPTQDKELIERLATVEVKAREPRTNLEPTEVAGLFNSVVLETFDINVVRFLDHGDKPSPFDQLAEHIKEYQADNEGKKPSKEAQETYFTEACASDSVVGTKARKRGTWSWTKYVHQLANDLTPKALTAEGEPDPKKQRPDYPLTTWISYLWDEWCRSVEEKAISSAKAKAQRDAAVTEKTAQKLVGTQAKLDAMIQLAKEKGLSDKELAQVLGE